RRRERRATGTGTAPEERRERDRERDVGRDGGSLDDETQRLAIKDLREETEDPEIRGRVVREVAGLVKGAGPAARDGLAPVDEESHVAGIPLHRRVVETEENADDDRERDRDAGAIRARCLPR